jgi:hypothetical protein
MFVFCISEMTYKMKKEYAFWATVCLLLSLVPEFLNALSEEADDTGKILQRLILVFTLSKFST